MSSKLTKRQQQILDIIACKPRSSLKEIANELGLSSVSNIHIHIKTLTEKKVIKKHKNSYLILNKKEYIERKLLRLESFIIQISDFLLLDLIEPEEG